MALFLKDPTLPASEINLTAPPALDLAIPKHNLLPPPVNLFHNPYAYNRLNMLTPPMLPCTAKAPSPPPIIPSLLSPRDPEAMCEAAARLLFMNVKWAKNIPAFASLSLSDRLLLLEKSWRDLFVIGSAQFLYPMEFKILSEGNNRIENKDIDAFDTALKELVNIRPDSNEYACLRAIVLFKTSIGDRNSEGSPTNTGSDFKRLQDLPAIAALQDHSRVVLNEVFLIFKYYSV